MMYLDLNIYTRSELIYIAKEFNIHHRHNFITKIHKDELIAIMDKYIKICINPIKNIQHKCIPLHSSFINQINRRTLFKIIRLLNLVRVIPQYKTPKARLIYLLKPELNFALYIIGDISPIKKRKYRPSINKLINLIGTY